MRCHSHTGHLPAQCTSLSALIERPELVCGHASSANYCLNVKIRLDVMHWRLVKTIFWMRRGNFIAGMDCLVRQVCKHNGSVVTVVSRTAVHCAHNHVMYVYVYVHVYVCPRVSLVDWSRQEQPRTEKERLGCSVILCLVCRVAGNDLRGFLGIQRSRVRG